MENQIKIPQSSGDSILRKPANSRIELLTITLETEIRKAKIAAEKHDKDRGVLGRFFGSKEYAHRNIAGLLIFVLIAIALIYTLIMLWCDHAKTHTQVLGFWGILTPIVTLSLGYIFGHSQGNKE